MFYKVATYSYLLTKNKKMKVFLEEGICPYCKQKTRLYTVDHRCMRKEATSCIFCQVCALTQVLPARWIRNGQVCIGKNLY